MSREITTVVDGLSFAECPRWSVLAVRVDVPHAGLP